jgi:N-acylneuraminate cytidylyltransferase
LNIAIIPARKNSQRIKNKNIKNFLGKPIISYSIKAARDSNVFDKIVVTTDSKLIKKVSLKSGADIVINRTKKLSYNNIGIVEVVRNTIKILEKKIGKINYVCCIFATAPLIEISKIKTAFRVIKKKKKGFVFSAKKINQDISNIFYLEKKKIKKIINKKNKKKDLVTDAGQFYWAKKEVWMKEKTTFSKDSSYILLDKMKAQDINTIDDWKLAEIMFKLSR